MIVLKTHNIFLRASFSGAASMNAFINQAIAETNTGYKNSQVPIILSLRCILSSSINDDTDLGNVLNAFKNSAGYKTNFKFSFILLNYFNMA